MAPPLSTAELCSRVSLSLLAYLCLHSLLPRSPIPTLVLALLMASTLYKSSFPWLVRRLVKTDMVPQRQGLIDAVATLGAYEKNSLAWNERRRSALKMAGWEGNQQAREIGYLDHIDKVGAAIRENGKLAQAVVDDAVQRFDISPVEMRAGMLKGNSKAIEALTHFARDWTAISEELDPLFNFINQSIDKYVTSPQSTLVIVPGSGLGRIAHELAHHHGFPQVEAVEFSSLMYLCNSFVYGPHADFSIHPFLHSYSHHITVKNHLRSVKFQRRKKPENLKLNYGDFREFTVENSKEYDTVLIVTAFFLDTAQNLFDYFQSIEALVGEGQRGVWINVGPLKYGTAPYVELSMEELRKLRKLRGWKDLDEPKAGEMAGYLTDKEGLWQGYYGLGKWVSEFKR